MTSWSCQIAPPLSTNEIYSGRRFKTKAYKQWIKDNGWQINLQPKPAARFRRCVVTVDIPFDYGADIDNALKSTLDLLQTMHIIANDKHVEEITVRRARSVTRNCRVTVRAL